MDPDKTLEQLRTLVAAVLPSDEKEDVNPREERDLLAEWFDNLDSWLSAGCFKPTDSTRCSSTSRCRASTVSNALRCWRS